MNLEKFVSQLRENKNLVILSENKKELICKSKFGSSKVIKLTKMITPELAFLSGMLIGDGHLHRNVNKREFRIEIDLTRKEIIELTSKMFRNAFGLKVRIGRIKDKRPNRQIRWRIFFNNKVLWNLFTQVIGIPTGKKSKKVHAPRIFMENKKLMKMFLSGLFLADGGRKGKKISFTTASPKLFNDIKEILTIFKISFFTRKWQNNGLRIFDVIIGKEKHINRFFKTFPFVKIKFSRGA